MKLYIFPIFFIGLLITSFYEVYVREPNADAEEAAVVAALQTKKTPLTPVISMVGFTLGEALTKYDIGARFVENGYEGIARKQDRKETQHKFVSYRNKHTKDVKHQIFVSLEHHQVAQIGLHAEYNSRAQCLTALKTHFEVFAQPFLGDKQTVPPSTDTQQDFSFEHGTLSVLNACDEKSVWVFMIETSHPSLIDIAPLDAPPPQVTMQINYVKEQK